MTQMTDLTPEFVDAMFRRADGGFRFARWGRPIVPVVFGVDDATLSTMKGAIEAVVTLAGHKMAETDVELGVNLMLFFCSDWSELPDVPNLDRLVPDLAELSVRLAEAGATQYRTFRYDDSGAIKACFTFIRVAGDVAEMAAETLALSIAVQSVLAWGDRAFADTSPLALAKGVAVLRPEIGAIIAASYDPVLPAMADDPSHALRLFARAQVGAQANG